jgi:ABC-2 type transport system permease protein
MITLFRDTWHLTARALRETIRQPAFEIQNIFIPLFFLAVTTGAIGQVSARAFGVDNYLAFQVPVAILQACAGGASTSSIAMVTDIERGYFDKLLLTPAPRISLALGRLLADGIRVTFLTFIVMVVGLVFGSGMESGPAGFVMILFIAGAFGLAYSGIGLSIALRTGSPQAAQVGFLIFFPLLFLSPAFAPKTVFAGWLEFLATVNPVTYVLEAQRELVLNGWDAEKMLYCFAAIGGLGAFTLTMTVLALRHRTA